MGWFNILICLILTYINYLLGIIYAVLITADNRYADRFEREDIKRVRRLQNRDSNDYSEAKKSTALFGAIAYIMLFMGIIFKFITFDLLGNIFLASSIITILLVFLLTDNIPS